MYLESTSQLEMEFQKLSSLNSTATQRTIFLVIHKNLCHLSKVCFACALALALNVNKISVKQADVPSLPSISVNGIWIWTSLYNSLSMSLSICRHVCCTHISKMPRCAFYFPIFYCQRCFWEEERRKGRGEPQTNVYIYIFFLRNAHPMQITQ